MTQAARKALEPGRPISLARRFAWASAGRLVVLTILLSVVVLVSVRNPTAGSYSVQLAMWTLCAAFALSALYTWYLRQGRHLHALVNVQLVLDQVIWTSVVYLSGGVTSGATSFYGVTCVIGALLGGFRGAALAAASGGACYALLVTALLQGWLAVPPDQPASVYAVTVSDVTYSGVATGLMLMAVVALAGTLAERLRITGGQLLHAEARASRAEREAALGRLSAGLAHEIRNPLGAISGSVALLGANPNLTSDERQLCDIIQREAARLNDLVADMLNLGNPRAPERRAVDVSRVVEDVSELSRHSGRGGTDVAIEAEVEPGALILADDGMLRQLCWNLVRNAVQASHAGGKVRVVTFRDGGRVWLEVIDHGSGLSAEAKPRIFDPFYTTRSRGTGIGLAVVERIARQHDFAIEVLDTAAGGATFRVDLGPEASETARAPAERPWTLFPKANG